MTSRQGNPQSQEDGPRDSQTHSARKHFSPAQSHSSMGGKTMRRLILQYITLRRFRRVLVILVAVLAAIFVWSWCLRGPAPTSAIGCKNRLAEFMWSKASDRKRILEGFGRDTSQLEEEYFEFMQSISMQCHDQMHFGPPDDGGWDVCMDLSYQFRAPCLVYSFGVGHDFRFEKGIEEKLGCEVHAFDPSMGVASHQYSEKGHFYSYGIDNINGYAVHGKWKMKKLGTIMKELNHTHRHIDYMKMDIEFSEWPALYDILQSGLANKIRQIAIEFHTPEMDIHIRPNHKCTWSKHETLATMMKILFDLRNSGFSTYYTRTNYRTAFESPFTRRERYCCHNLHMVNTKHPLNGWKPPPKMLRRGHH